MNNLNLIVHVNRTALEINTKEYKQQYNTNMQQWSVAQANSKNGNSLTDNLIQSFMLASADFWLRVENLNPYNKPGQIMISLSFNYIGTNKFYGYVTTGFYNNLIETFSN